MAVPHVTGVAALLRMAFPECSNIQIRKVLAYTAKDLEKKGCDEKTGHGLVRGNKAYEFLEKYRCGALEGKPDGGCYKVTLKEKNIMRNEVSNKKKKKKKS